MRDCNSRDGDTWLMVDDNGERTLFQLVEMARGADAQRMANKLPARAVVVDIALPALPALDEKPEKQPRSARSRLILLNVRTGNDRKSVVRFCPPAQTGVDGRPSIQD